MDLLDQYEDKKLKHINIEVIADGGDVNVQKKIALRNKDILIIETPTNWTMELVEDVTETFIKALGDDKMQAIVIPQGLTFKVISVNEK